MAAVLRQLRRRGNAGAEWYKSSCLQHGIALRMRALGVETLAGYARRLARDPGESGLLMDGLSIRVTGFFRDPESWRRLREILAGEPAAGAPTFGWSMGCATGEEAWSLAILLLERSSSRASDPGFQVLGSDLDTRALSVARMGSYPDLDPSVIREVLPHLGAGMNGTPFQVSETVRERVRFQQEDLTRVAAPPELFDVVCCRNVLIFLSREGQDRVLDAAVRSLRPGGILMLGRTESPGGVAHRLTPIDPTHRIFRKGQ